MKLILFFLFFSGISFGKVSSLKLKQVYSNKIVQFTHSTKNNDLIIFTAPDCAACVKQIKDLSCLGNTPIHLISIRGSEKEIYKEYRKKDIKRDIYLGGNDAIDFFKLKNNYTPQLLVRKTNQIFHLKGYTKCPTLEKLLKSEK